MANFGDLQNEIYLAGLSGVVPSLPMSFAELERRAELALPPGTWSYVAGGAGDEHTQRSNRTAFDHWGLVPRMLRASTDRDLSVELFGITFRTPVFLAPIGVIGICTQERPRRPGRGPRGRRYRRADGGLDAERGPAGGRGRGVRRDARVLPALLPDRSGGGGQPGSAGGGGGLPRDRGHPRHLGHRLAAAGSVYLELPAAAGPLPADYFSDPVFRSRLQKPPEEDPGTAILTWALMFGRPLTWDDLAWLRSLTTLPIVLKGICHPDDARRAVDEGIDGIYVSTHGGRQANGGLAAIDCLADVAEAVPDVPVLFDSGVRSGSDVVKALALGATAVGIGRPYVYGAALGGTDGIVHVLRTILAEADLLMAVDGYPTVADLSRDAIRRC